jgi:hypothetical protein
MLPPFPILSKMKPVHELPSYVFKVHNNIIIDLHLGLVVVS